MVDAIQLSSSGSSESLADGRRRRLQNLESQLAALENQRAELERTVDEYRGELALADRVRDRKPVEVSLARLNPEVARLSDRIAQLVAQLRPLQIQDLEECAQSCEMVDALTEALNLWRKLLEIEPQHGGALEGVARVQLALDRKQKNSILADRLKPLVASKHLEPKFYAAVVKTLLAAHKSVSTMVPEIGLTEMLVDGTLSPEAFIIAWNELQTQTQPPSGVMTPEVDFRVLAERLHGGELVVLLGTIHQTPDQLADALAGEMGNEVATERRHRSTPPSEIAQYFEMKKEYGPLDLIRHVSHILPRAAANARLFRLLANRRKPLLVISASHDTLLEDAFAESGRKYVVVSAVVEGNAAVPAGHVILRYSDRDRAEPPMQDQGLSHEAPMEKGYSVLFKVRGVCDEKADASDPIHRTFTLSEGRYFAFARQVDKQIPSYVAKHFNGRGLLVLGYQPVFWEDRLILNAIIDRCRATGERSTVVTTDRRGFAADYWRSRGVEQFAYALDDFVNKLEGAIPR